MSVYNSWYISKARKFNVKATRSEKGTVLLEIETYDGLKLDATPEQWGAIVGAVTPHLKNTGASRPPATPPPTEEPEY